MTDMITVDYGITLLPPIEYRAVGGKLPRRWWQWRDREEWYIHSPFCTIGPFDSATAACETLSMMKGR